MWRFALLLMPVLGASSPPPPARDTVRVCLAPTSVQTVGPSEAAVEAVRETFKSFLNGPSITVAPLGARLVSLARDEAKQSNCPLVLFTTLKHERKERHGFLTRAAASVVETGASTVVGSMASAGSQAAMSATISAAAAVRDLATSVRIKDEMTLSYRLENAAGGVLVDKTENRKAKSDGEDLLTPLVERAAEVVVVATKTGKG